ncbi:MAG: ABC transporter ATP-binding protein [Streptosporangiaceae bacterium]|jgi:oligopeptide/dipeptide ABC transporter ATP-binding protein
MAEPRLEATDLRVGFPVAGGRVLRALDGVSLRAGAGQILGLVGESGCGKTTAARCLAGLLAPESGTVRLDGAELGARRTVAQRRAIQMIFQDPYSSLNPRLSVRRTLRELLAVHDLVPRAGREDRCRELMSLVGLPAAALDGLPGQFSGGQRQRIAIARALAAEPRVLIADEPVSSLDVSVQATILRLFADLRDRLGLTVVIISHDLAVVRQLSDQVAVMYLGRVVEEGPAGDLFGSVRHPYARALLAAAPRLHQYAVPRPELLGEPPSPVDLPSGCRFHPRCPRAEDICRREDPLPRPVRPGSTHIVACHFGADPLIAG